MYVPKIKTKQYVITCVRVALPTFVEVLARIKHGRWQQVFASCQSDSKSVKEDFFNMFQSIRVNEVNFDCISTKTRYTHFIDIVYLFPINFYPIACSIRATVYNDRPKSTLLKADLLSIKFRQIPFSGLKGVEKCLYITLTLLRTPPYGKWFLLMKDIELSLVSDSSLFKTRRFQICVKKTSFYLMYVNRL